MGKLILHTKYFFIKFLLLRLLRIFGNGFLNSAQIASLEKSICYYVDMEKQRRSMKDKIDQALKDAHFSGENSSYVLLDGWGRIGYAYSICQKDWFKSVFGTDFDPTTMGDNCTTQEFHGRFSQFNAIRRMARLLVKSERDADTVESCAVMVFITLHMMGKGAFSTLTKYLGRHNVNWRPIADAESIDAQIVALRLQNRI